MMQGIELEWNRFSWVWAGLFLVTILPCTYWLGCQLLLQPCCCLPINYHAQQGYKLHVLCDLVWDNGCCVHCIPIFSGKPKIWPGWWSQFQWFELVSTLRNLHIRRCNVLQLMQLHVSWHDFEHLASTVVLYVCILLLAIVHVHRYTRHESSSLFSTKPTNNNIESNATVCAVIETLVLI